MYFHDHPSACGQFDRWRRGDPALYRDWKSWSNPLYRSNKVNKMDSFPIRKYEVISYRGKVDKENTKKERVNEENAYRMSHYSAGSNSICIWHRLCMIVNNRLKGLNGGIIGDRG